MPHRAHFLHHIVFYCVFVFVTRLQLLHYYPELLCPVLCFTICHCVCVDPSLAMQFSVNVKVRESKDDQMMTAGLHAIPRHLLGLPSRVEIRMWRSPRHWLSSPFFILSLVL